RARRGPTVRRQAEAHDAGDRDSRGGPDLGVRRRIDGSRTRRGRDEMKGFAWAAAALVVAGGCKKSAEPGGDCAGDFLAGDLVITEVMPNPVGDDTGKEWFEIYNARAQTVDASGLELVTQKADGTGEAVHVVVGPQMIGGHTYFVFGASTQALKP